MPEPHTIYIAGSSKERQRVRERMHWIHAQDNLVLTFDWERHIDAVQTVLPLEDKHLPEAVQRDSAEKDTSAVVHANILWLLIPRTESTGCHTELGIAIGYMQAMQRNAPTVSKRHIIASGTGKFNIFYTMADHRFVDDADAQDWLSKLAGA